MSADNALSARPFLFSGPVDFFLVGGISLFLIPLILFLEHLSVDISSVAFALFYIAFLINNPHFTHSYQLLYPGFFSKVFNPAQGKMAKLRLVVAGVIAPIVLLGYLGFAFFIESRELMSYALNAMFFFVGWHYVKQGYGVLLVFSGRQGYFFTDKEKRILLTNVYVTWLATWVLANTSAPLYNYHHIPFHSLGFPGIFGVIATAACLITALPALRILYLRLRLGQTSGNGITGYICALYPWTVLASINKTSLLIIPALHSLQYLLFVWKLKYEKEREARGHAEDFTPLQYFASLARLHKARFYVVGYISGLMFFYVVPAGLDHFVAYNHAELGNAAFMFMFLVFINIHHYFIDFAIWRKENPEMKYLYR